MNFSGLCVNWSSNGAGIVAGHSVSRSVVEQPDSRKITPCGEGQIERRADHWPATSDSRAGAGPARADFKFFKNHAMRSNYPRGSLLAKRMGTIQPPSAREKARYEKAGNQKSRCRRGACS